MSGRLTEMNEAPRHPARRFVRLFKAEFASAVQSGAKCMTIRPEPKRMPLPGDRISLRCWTGKPYRSKQRFLGEATIRFVGRVWIGRDSMVAGTCQLTAAGEHDFARQDGFRDAAALRAWFDAEHGLPFWGVLIIWSKPIGAAGE